MAAAVTSIRDPPSNGSQFYIDMQSLIQWQPRLNVNTWSLIQWQSWLHKYLIIHPMAATVTSIRDPSSNGSHGYINMWSFIQWQPRLHQYMIFHPMAATFTSIRDSSSNGSHGYINTTWSLIQWPPRLQYGIPQCSINTGLKNWDWPFWFSLKDLLLADCDLNFPTHFFTVCTINQK